MSSEVNSCKGFSKLNDHPKVLKLLTPDGVTAAEWKDMLDDQTLLDLDTFLEVGLFFFLQILLDAFFQIKVDLGLSLML